MVSMFFSRMRRVFIAMTLSYVALYYLNLGGGGLEENVSLSLLKNPDMLLSIMIKIDQKISFIDQL